MLKILIKGAGDLATGIAYRLYQGGYQIMMTETAVPTTVRRTVAFSRSVYEGSCEVEGVTAELARNFPRACELVRQGKIAVLIDEKAEILKDYQPDVVVDAILAKRNLGTKIEDACLVIGVGPGFSAGLDCHAVIETKRGHYLGRVIREGSAIPNTGIPGDIGGYTTERLIPASASGLFQPIARIGEVVKKDQTVALVDGTPVFAQMNGIVRGMLQEGVKVVEGMKAGDIDARCEQAHCFTISDKARAIGGGVLEAVVNYEHKSN